MKHPSDRFPHFVRIGRTPSTGIEVLEAEGNVRSLPDTDNREFVEMERISGPGLDQLLALRKMLVDHPLTHEEKETFSPLKRYWNPEGWDQLSDPDKERRMASYRIAVLKAMADFASIVEELHALGFYHRDLKPDVIRISPRGPVMLDFGSALRREDISPSTEVGFIFTNHYLAPELTPFMKEKNDGYVIDSTHYTPQIDVYSLGQCLAYLMTGTPSSIYGEMFRMTPENLPNELVVQLVHTSMAQDIHQRLPDPKALKLMLKSLLWLEGQIDTRDLTQVELHPEVLDELKALKEQFHQQPTYSIAESTARKLYHEESMAKIQIDASSSGEISGVFDDWDEE
ncbi:MAG: hypothetical protein AB7J46_01935 [Candidatus Altimarinota bacterium]